MPKHLSDASNLTRIVDNVSSQGYKGVVAFTNPMPTLIERIAQDIADEALQNGVTLETITQSAHRKIACLPLQRVEALRAEMNPAVLRMKMDRNGGNVRQAIAQEIAFEAQAAYVSL